MNCSTRARDVSGNFFGEHSPSDLLSKDHLGVRLFWLSNVQFPAVSFAHYRPRAARIANNRQRDAGPCFSIRPSIIMRQSMNERGKHRRKKARLGEPRLADCIADML